MSLIECCAGQLNQVFMNILANAIDAIEENKAHGTFAKNKVRPGCITIRTSMLDLKLVEIAIADNGSGIPDTVQKQIFEPFYTTKPVEKGTGMGMVISHQIITEKHSGKLECPSAQGQGTEFIIQILVVQRSMKPVN